MCAKRCRNISINLKIKLYDVAKLYRIFFSGFYFEPPGINEVVSRNYNTVHTFGTYLFVFSDVRMRIK